MKGVLTLVKSVNPPVFGDKPLKITFPDRPKKGELFTFSAPAYGPCYMSTIRSLAIDSEEDRYLLTTRNSLYLLEVL